MHFSDMKIHINSKVASERSDRARIKVICLIYVQLITFSIDLRREFWRLIP